MIKHYWRDRAPTPEEIKAHAAAHGFPRGIWRVRTFNGWIVSWAASDGEDRTPGGYRTLSDFEHTFGKIVASAPITRTNRPVPWPLLDEEEEEEPGRLVGGEVVVAVEDRYQALSRACRQIAERLTAIATQVEAARLLGDAVKVDHCGAEIVLTAEEMRAKHLEMAKDQMQDIFEQEKRYAELEQMLYALG